MKRINRTVPFIHTMNNRPRHIRNCRSHERRWNNICVDRHLRDEWLSRLNELTVLILVNICEGISKRRGGGELIYGRPHIYFKIRPDLFDLVAKAFYEKNIKIAIPQKIFSSLDTVVDFELRSVFRKMSVNFTYREEIILKLTFNRQRDSENIDEETINWFETAIPQIEVFDRFLIRM